MIKSSLKEMKSRTGKNEGCYMLYKDNLVSIGARVTQRFTVADSLLKIKFIGWITDWWRNKYIQIITEYDGGV